MAEATALTPSKRLLKPSPTLLPAAMSLSNAPVSLTWLKNVCRFATPDVARSVTRPLAVLIAPVTVGLNRLNASVRPPVTAASRLPIAPSMVWVLVAACLATSVIPRSSNAWLNSSAVICPSAMASRKLPV